MWQDLGERIIVHYDVVNNAIVKHNNYEDEPIFEYLDVWEAEIPETYVDLTEWLGEIYFSGQINGIDWNICYHGGYIEDRLNINGEMEKILFQNFNEYPTSTGFVLKNNRDSMEFNNFHEGLHIGVIMAIRKLV